MRWGRGREQDSAVYARCVDVMLSVRQGRRGSPHHGSELSSACKNVLVKMSDTRTVLPVPGYR